MKKIFALTLCLLIALGATPVCAHIFEGEYIYSSVVTLPEDDGSGYPITGVNTERYRENSYIEELIVPENIVRLGEELFYWCFKLRTISLHGGIQSIGEKCFYGTAYYNDESNWDADGVLYIGDNLIRADPERIGTTYEIPSGVRLIADGAFRGCYGLESVTIPDSVEYVGKDAFADTALLTAGEREDGLLYVDSILIACDTIACDAEVAGVVEIREGTRTIADAAFLDADGVTEVRCPDSLRHIGQDAFCGCSALKKMDLNRTETVGRGPFYGCDELSVLTVSEENAFFTVRDGVLFDKEQTTVVRCPQKKTGTVVLPETTVRIAAYSFTDCAELERVVVPEGVLFVGYDAFHGCGLRELTLPESVEYIDKYAFCECDGISEVAIPSGATYLGDGAFMGCSGLETVSFGEAIDELRDYTFADCENLTTVRLVASSGKALSWISYSAFSGTRFLQNTTRYENGLLLLGGKYLIRAAEDVKTCDIPEGVVGIADGALSDVSDLRVVRIPSGVRKGLWGLAVSIDDSVRIDYDGTTEDFERVYDGYLNDLNLHTNDLRFATAAFGVLLFLLIGFVVGVRVWESVRRKKESCELRNGEDETNEG